MKTISFRNDVLPLKNELFRLALRITLRKEDAEDVVQDTLIKVWNNRDNWRNIDSIEAYCLTVCRNLSLDKVKKAGRNDTSYDEAAIPERSDSASNPYEQMIQQDRLLMVRKLINALPEKQRTCMQFRDFEGKSYKEIADVLGITEEQVKVNIFRGRQRIRQQYEEINKYGL